MEGEWIEQNGKGRNRIEKEAFFLLPRKGVSCSEQQSCCQEKERKFNVTLTRYFNLLQVQQSTYLHHYPPGSVFEEELFLLNALPRLKLWPVKVSFPTILFPSKHFSKLT